MFLQYFFNPKTKVKYILVFFLIVSTLSGEGIDEAERYNKNSHLQWDLAIKFIKTIPWTEEDNILDVGCGDGKITALIADVCAVSSIKGVDVSYNMIDFARKNYTEPNLFFIQSDVEQINFREEFTKVVSFSALHWVIDQEKAFAKIYESLVPGGKVYILTYGKSPMNISALAEKLIHSEKWKDYFSSYKPTRIYLTKEQCYSYLQKVGFVEIGVKQKVEQLVYPSRAAFIDFIQPLLSFTHHLSEELQKEFVEEIADQVIACKASSNLDQVIFEVNLMQISAKKN